MVPYHSPKLAPPTPHSLLSPKPRIFTIPKFLLTLLQTKVPPDPRSPRKYLIPKPQRPEYIGNPLILMPTTNKVITLSNFRHQPYSGPFTFPFQDLLFKIYSLIFFSFLQIVGMESRGVGG